MTKTIFSPENVLIWEDVKKAVKNTVIFASPLLIAFLASLQQGATLQEAVGYLWAALIQFLLDLVVKWKTEKSYVVEK